MKLNRRQVFGGLLVAGPVWADPRSAVTADPRVDWQLRPHMGLQVGLALPPGSGSEALARRWVARLSQAWPAPVSSVALSTDDAALVWSHEPVAAERVLLATAWWPADAGWPLHDAAAKRPMTVLAVLARAPLALLVDRFAPPAWAGVRDAVQSADPPLRCAVDEGAAAVSQRLLQSLGLSAARPLPFRGAGQLLAAIAGSRVPLAVCTAGQVVGAAWQSLPLEAAPGHLDDVAAAHHRGDVRVLAVAHASRLPSLPGVPTVDELLGNHGNDTGRCLLLLAPADRAEGLTRRLRAALHTA